MRAAHLGPSRRRPQIVEIAARAFAAHGYQGASLRAIADEAGVAKAVIYDCFTGGKPALYEAVIDRAAGHLEDAVLDPVDPAAPPSAVVATVLRGLVTALDEEPFALALLLGITDAEPAPARHLAAIRERLLARMLGLLGGATSEWTRGQRRPKMERGEGRPQRRSGGSIR